MPNRLDPRYTPGQEFIGANLVEVVEEAGVVDLRMHRVAVNDKGERTDKTSVWHWGRLQPGKDGTFRLKIYAGDKFKAVDELVLSRAKPQPPREDPFMRKGGSHWKWRFEASAPYKELTVQLALYERTEAGDFTRRVIAGSTTVRGQAKAADNIHVQWADDNGHPRIGVSVDGSGTVATLSHLQSSGYVRLGEGEGAPQRVGTESILLARYRDDTPTGRKTDMTAYVAVEIQTK